MATIEFHCAECGKLEVLSDPLIVKTGNTKGWLCCDCIEARCRP